MKTDAILHHATLRPNGKKDLAYFQIVFKDNNFKSLFEKKFTENFTNGEFIFGIKFYIIKIPWDKKDLFISFVDDFKKEHKTKSIKIKKIEHFICFVLSIHSESNKSFRETFYKKFPSDNLSINDIATISEKRTKTFEEFLKKFNSAKT